MVRFNCEFREQENKFKLSFNEASSLLNVNFGVIQTIERDVEVYTGATVVIPSRSTVVLQTRNKKVLEEITINPIPSNYGLITYNGFEITVS